MEIWDSHVHLFPPEIYRHWEKYAARDAWFASLTKPSPNGKGTEEAWADAKEALMCADAAGVYGLVMQGWYWNDKGLIQMHNDYMADCLKSHPDRLKGFIAANPMFGDWMIYEIERCYPMGFSGVGELGPGGNGYDFNSPELYHMLEVCQSMHLPVCIHCGEPVGRTYPGRDMTPLAPLPDLLKHFPELTLILAHMGGGLPFYEMLKGFQKHFKNVYYDTAANPLLYDIRSIRMVMALVGEDRLLYGSDFPLLLYPSQCRTMDMTRFVSDIKDHAGLTQTQYERLMGENLKNILDERIMLFSLK